MPLSEYKLYLAMVKNNLLYGILLNIIASILFSLMFGYTKLLSPLNGNEIYGWRMILTFPILTIFIILNRNLDQVKIILNRILEEKFFIVTRFISSILIGGQLWLFMWGPNNGYGLDISLGYFIMPIVMVVFGRFFFKEKVSNFQKVSCLFAVVGILNMLLISSTFKWPTLLVSVGYPIYFSLRKVTNTNNIGSLWFDMLLSLPISIFFIINNNGVFSGLLGIPSHTTILILGLGLISASALGLQSLSAPHLNLTLFGLLFYVEPILLVVVSIVLGERIKTIEWPTYIALWLAVSMLISEGVINFKRLKS